MKTLKLMLLILLCTRLAYADNKDSVELNNLLQAPSSPAANLLNTSPSDIARPTDPAAFMISVQNAAQNFNSFPSSYAVDVAPAWLFWGKKIKYDDLRDNSFKHTIWQSLQLSAAYTNTEDSINNSRSTSLGLGIKASISRGKFTDKMDSLVRKSDTLAAFATIKRDSLERAIIENHPQVKAYDILRANYWRNNDSLNKYTNLQNLLISKLRDSIGASLVQDYNQIKDLIKNIDFDRYGWKLDVTAGIAIDYPNQVFDLARMNKAGVWLTGGYSTQKGLSVLGVARYLYNPDKIYADKDGILKQDDLSTLDGGMRILYDSPENKFTFSGEAVYRSVLQKTDVNPTWRFTINADYELAPQKILSLAFGRNFDGTFNKDGNVIAAINFVMGFGNKIKAR